eukprot:CAMPEP_0117769722 /NCGR_PEP_ID=MMETSP0947-20121206/23256_1 /TAXON_ID=44440 /ORGANISM="Chattonella subsalsa, Strain CCMP2191" /LENGTH=198 /DNA_ID=CAMNT_0005594381 /DNA_START=154 /DNA_END=746 /DNA_ORIENTATION=+
MKQKQLKTWKNVESVTVGVKPFSSLNDQCRKCHSGYNVIFCGLCDQPLSYHGCLDRKADRFDTCHCCNKFGLSNKIHEGSYPILSSNPMPPSLHCDSDGDWDRNEMQKKLQMHLNMLALARMKSFFKRLLWERKAKKSGNQVPEEPKANSFFDNGIEQSSMEKKSYFSDSAAEETAAPSNGQRRDLEFSLAPVFNKSS